LLPRPRTLPAAFIQPCLPTKAPRPPSGALHEIKHDGFRVIARKEGDDADRLCDYALAKLWCASLV
jgi:ATP-dependent DNA ligase